MTSYCYLNGKILPATNAKISVNDIGILRGYGVFDILRTYNGRPFQLKDHLKRFARSAKILNLVIPLSDRQLEDVIKKLIAKNGLKESRVRIVLTGGESMTGMDFNPKTPTLFILVEKFSALPAGWYKNGAKLITVEHQRNLPEAKIINYQTGIKNLPELKKRNAAELLYVHQGKILEGMGSNFFLIRGNTLITPEKNILKGTTRNLVLKLAKNKFRIHKREIKIGELKTADECFVTSITKGILPIVKIDKQIIAGGKVGPKTKQLMAELAKVAAKN